MEIEKLISVLEEILVYLRRSESSDYSNTSVEEMIEKLETELAKAIGSQPVDAESLGFLFAPTGPIQETAIDNGWGDEYLRISDVVDQFTKAN
jgi:hypothetical protein